MFVYFNYFCLFPFSVFCTHVHLPKLNDSQTSRLIGVFGLILSPADMHGQNVACAYRM